MGPNGNLGYLLHHLAFTLDRQSDQVLLERLGIGFSQFKILMALKWHVHFQQKEIADYLGQTEASVSRQVKLMKKRGLVHTKSSPKSRRDHIVALTSKGERIAEAATDILNSYFTPVFDQLSEKQQSQLGQALMVMHAKACPFGDRCAVH